MMVHNQNPQYLFLIFKQEFYFETSTTTLMDDLLMFPNDTNVFAWPISC